MVDQSIFYVIQLQANSRIVLDKRALYGYSELWSIEIMITTVSTTTVTTVTTIAAMGLTAAISMAATVILILFLSTRELARAGTSSFSLRLSRFFSIGILPLVLVFAVIMMVEVIEVST